jgi:four helix bundle protein
VGEPVRTFRDLIAWQKGHLLTRMVYQFSRQLPREEVFGLTSQMRRASSSIPLNVAEGYGLGTRDQFLRHLRQARASCMEVDTAIDLAKSICELKPEESLISLIAETDRVIQGLIRSLENKSEYAS